MKKYIIGLMLLCSILQSHAQGWIGITKTSPAYSYSMPATPTIKDTLNVRLAYLQTDSLAVFEVMEFQNTPLDSANVAFDSALTSTSGDTLLAIAQTMAAANNATILSSQAITTFSDYKGLEIYMQYNDSISGETAHVYSRFFYNARTLIVFTITGTQANNTQLVSDKNQFFSSINMSTLD